MLEPHSEEALADVICSAAGPLRIQGGGTRTVPVSGETISTSGLNGIRLYEPGALTIVAGAGTPLSIVADTLAQENQRLPFEPPDFRGLLGQTGVSTIGGVVAANASGPRRIQSGAARDSLIGARFVDGAGNILKNGGRVMKNVTGYDLVKLVAGSHGTLGIITEVAFKVLPSPPVQAVLTAQGLSPDQAVAAMSSALASPFEVSGAAHYLSGPQGGPLTMIRIEGFERAVLNRVRHLSDRLAAFGEFSSEMESDRCAEIWKGVRDVKAFHDAQGDVWRISIKPSDAPFVINQLDARDISLDWGGGLVWALTEPGYDVRANLRGLGGHATLLRPAAGSEMSFPQFHPEMHPLAAISHGLRQKFDPRQILNPGVMA